MVALSNGARDGIARRVVYGDPQMKATALGGSVFCLADLAQQQIGQTIAPSDDLQPGTVLPQSFRLQAQVSPHQPENALHLVGRTAPVVR